MMLSEGINQRFATLKFFFFSLTNYQDMYILNLQIRKLIDEFGSRVLWVILCCCILMCIIF